MSTVEGTMVLGYPQHVTYKDVCVVSEMEGDMDLRMTVVGEVLVFEGPEVVGEVGVG